MEHNPPRLTLARLAEHLGVSRTTVSNAYNRPDQLSSELRERILAAARELAYTGPNPAARALSRGRHGTVGVLFTETLAYAFSDAAAVLVLQGLAQLCGRERLGILLLPVNADQGTDADVVRSAAVDSFVVYSMPDDNPLVAAAVERRIPTVFIDHPRPPRHPFVGIDDEAAAYSAARHVIDLGHRRLAIIAYRLAASPTDGPVTAERRRLAQTRGAGARLPGYLRAVSEAPTPIAHLPIWELAHNTPEDGYQAAITLLRASQRPTALLLDSDQLALGALRAAHELDIAVPRQLSIVGLDDIPAAANSTPPLTTIRQPLLDKGVAAGRLLIEATQGRPPRTVTLPTQLVLRGSTAPADPAGDLRASREGGNPVADVSQS
jgi:DNA-binding LacI/PurR family transcriptional regulator